MTPLNVPLNAEKRHELPSRFGSMITSGLHQPENDRLTKLCPGLLKVCQHKMEHK